MDPCEHAIELAIQDLQSRIFFSKEAAAKAYDPFDPNHPIENSG